MTKCLKEMQKAASSETENSTVLNDINKRLEEYNKLSETFYEIRMENSELKEINKDLESNKESVEARIKESKYN